MTAVAERIGYDIHAVEAKWRARWAAAGCFKAEAGRRGPKHYNFDGGPFPNGALHMGHVRTFTLGDVTARYKRMRGCNVLYAFEFDAFGLPNELAAQAEGLSPRELTRRNIASMRRQMERLGLSYDWDHVHDTSDPAYYRWTQWLFLRLWERGLVYRDRALLNYCPACETTLAHMQVVDGSCWRCGERVVQQERVQWFVRLSEHEASLAAELQSLDGWSEQVRRVIGGFIGRTEGFDVDLAVLAPAHARGAVLSAFARDLDIVERMSHIRISPASRSLETVVAAADAVRLRSDLSMRPRRRTGENEEASDVDLGIRVRHPVHGHPLPVLISSAVDPWFANGALVAAPDPGDSSTRNGAMAAGARVAAGAWPVARVVADDSGTRDATIRPAVHYRAHDWLVSRQRRWGTPIPVVCCPSCGDVPVPDDALPVPLPPADGHPPVRCPCCREPARLDPDTLDCYFDVLWCYLACMSRLDAGFSFAPQDFAHWYPVDCFHNGVDSAFYAHLYRFLGRVLHETRVLDSPEPIIRYHGHGLVRANGEKMSKQRGNAPVVDDLLSDAGGDVLRLHVLWGASPLKSIDWTAAALVGARRFLNRVWNLVAPRARAIREALACADRTGNAEGPLASASARAQLRITAFLESYRISACIEELNGFTMSLARFAEAHPIEADPEDPGWVDFSLAARTLVILLAPFCPYLSEELWERIGGSGFVSAARWPAGYDDS